MKGKWRLLIALGVTAAVVVGLAMAWAFSGRALVIIDNRSDTALNLSVETANAGQFSWAGELAPRRRVIRTARFSDNSFIIVCRDAEGIYRQRGGYITSRMLQRVDIVAASCSSVRIDVRSIP